MKKAAVLFVALLLPLIGRAETVTVTWQPPTRYTNGDTIAATGTGALKTTHVEYGTCSAPGVFGTAEGSIPVAHPATTLELNLVVVQEYCLRAFAETNGGQRSDASNVVVRAVAPPRPAPPENLTVTGDTTAYTLILSNDRVALVPVGEVQPGTECDETQPILDKFVVPRAAVLLVGDVQPRVVVASCSGV